MPLAALEDPAFFPDKEIVEIVTKQPPTDPRSGFDSWFL
jgi:hypothetical protein